MLRNKARKGTLLYLASTFRLLRLPDWTRFPDVSCLLARGSSGTSLLFHSVPLLEKKPGVDSVVAYGILDGWHTDQTGSGWPRYVVTGEAVSSEMTVFSSFSSGDD